MIINNFIAAPVPKAGPGAGTILQLSLVLSTSVVLAARWKASVIFLVVCWLNMVGGQVSCVRSLLTEEPNPLTAAIISLPPA